MFLFVLSDDVTLVQILKARNGVSSVTSFPFAKTYSFCCTLKWLLWLLGCGVVFMTGRFLWDVATDSCLLLKMDCVV